MRDARRVDQPLEEVPPEARRVVGGDADVLVEVEHLHAVPGTSGQRDERGEELELRGAGRRDDPRAAGVGDGGADGLGGVRSRCRTQGLRGREDGDVHGSRVALTSAPCALG